MAVWAAAGFTSVLILTAGCNGNPGDTGRTVSQEEMKSAQERQQRQVLDNPNLPPQARAAAMGSMRQGQSSGQQSGKSQKENIARSADAKK